MTLTEIYSKIASHMIQGMMIHENMANYYDFLGLQGYKSCHEYHFLSETCNFRKLNAYFISHHNKLIPEENIEPTKVIPDSWFRATQMDVDNGTKRTAVKNGLTMWRDWEKDTKKLYEEMYKELMEINEVSSALFIQEFICDVDDELESVDKYILNKMAIDYDLSVIIPEQDCWKDEYCCKIENIGNAV